MGFGAMPLALFVLRSPELEPQHFDDSVGMLVRIVLSASGLVAADAVGAVCVVVLCSVVAVAVLWHVVAVFFRSGRFCFLCSGRQLSSQIVLLLWRSVCTKSHHHFLPFLSQQVMSSELVLSHL